MRVGFDVLPLVHPFPPGVVRAVRGTLEALEARGNVEVVRLELERHPFRGAWSPRHPENAAAMQGLAGLHSFTSGIPWRYENRLVQTIHEAPWRHGVAENAGLGHRLWASLGPLVADRVVCPTEHVRACLAVPKWRGGNRLRVVPWGVGPPFAAEAPADVDDAAVVAECVPDLRGPFVLGLGVTRPKKSLAALLAGVDALRERGTAVSVVVTGPETAELARLREVADTAGFAAHLHHAEHLPEDALPSFLRRAAAVSVLSRSEGFGFPALEALACGTPALVRPASAPAEVTGDVGLVVDPADREAVADGIARALDSDAVAREARLERAALYSWDRTAEGVENVWKEIG